MRYLGVDYGSKRVGLAISDESLNFSFPLKVLENNDKFLLEFKKVCDENDVSLVVVGESKNFSFDENAIMKDIKVFIENIEKLGIKTVLHPELLTSEEAKRLQGENEMLDASAAAIILKSYLDTKNNGK